MRECAGRGAGGSRGRAQAQTILTRLAASSAAAANAYGTVVFHAEVSPDSKPLGSGTDKTGGRCLPPFGSDRSCFYCGSTVVGSEVTLSSTEP